MYQTLKQLVGVKKEDVKRKSNMKNTELRQLIRESLFELMTEKLCPKGKAYVARRKAAGEKHGAYLMGRAVKVCKGQMSGKKKKKKNEDALALSKQNMSQYQLDANKSENLYEVYVENELYYVESLDEIQMIEDALNLDEYCPSCAAVEEGRKKKKCKPSKGKRFAKRVNGKCRSFGQKGKASDGGDRIRPGTKKAHAYCARSAKIKKCKNPPCANTLSRKKWKCQGSRSVPEQYDKNKGRKLKQLNKSKDVSPNINCCVETYGFGTTMGPIMYGDAMCYNAAGSYVGDVSVNSNGSCPD